MTIACVSDQKRYFTPKVEQRVSLFIIVSPTISCVKHVEPANRFIPLGPNGTQRAVAVMRPDDQAQIGRATMNCACIPMEIHAPLAIDQVAKFITAITG